MSKKTFAEAEAYCTSHGLLLAQPVDPDALRQYLIANGGMFFNHIIFVNINYCNNIMYNNIYNISYNNSCNNRWGVALIWIF